MKWPMYPLGQLCDVIIGATPARKEPAYWGGDNVWVTVSELNDNTICDSKEHITDLGIQNSASKLIPKGTLLFSFKLSIGKMAFAGVDLYTNEAIAALPIRRGVPLDNRFLYYALRQFDSSLGAHIAVKGKLLNKRKIKRIPIPLPPLSEQRRIVEILDQADALRKKRAEADAKAARILPALFYKMFGDPLALMRDRNSIPLGQFDIDLQNGFACGQKDVEDGVPHLRMNNIDDAGVLNLDLIRTVPPEKDDRRYRLQGGDVLFMGTNSEDKIGKTCVFFPPDGRHYLFSNHLIRIRISDSRLSPEFLATYLHLLWVKRFYPLIAKRWVNQATVAQAALAKVRIPVQHKQSLKDFNQAFSELLLSRDKRIQSTKRVNDLFGVLLHRAFTGDLTAQWREAHMKELLEEMEEQAKALNLEIVS